LSLDGTWNLEVSTPFGKHPATLNVSRERDGSLSGRIDSRLGSALLSDINATGDAFDATVSLDIKGQTYYAKVSGTVEDGRIEGTIRVNIPMAPPARFTGTRQ
jgi:hypothetical protein